MNGGAAGVCAGQPEEADGHASDSSLAEPAAAGCSRPVGVGPAFPGGGQYRVEIPSVEGPEAFAAVVEAAAEHNVPVHRASQGTGIVLQTDAEIERMVKLGAEIGIEVCLFTGPRAAWDIGVQATTSSGRVAGAVLRGQTSSAAAGGLVRYLRHRRRGVAERPGVHPGRRAAPDHRGPRADHSRPRVCRPRCGGRRAARGPRSLACRLGADRAVPPDDAAVLQADVAVESAGRPQAVATAVRALRSGGRAVLLGLGPRPVSVLPMDLVGAEKSIIGSLSHVWDTDFRIALGLMGRGVVQAAPLVTDRIPITAAVSGGLELLRDEPEKHLKILVRPGGTR